MSEPTHEYVYEIMHADGKRETRKTPKRLALKELQTIVGGYVETAKSKKKPNHILIFNEEGKLLGLPPNPHTEEGYPYVGTVVRCRNSAFA
jgi:hypothetical protein